MDYISQEWPIVYKQSLYVNNKKANIAIITYWSDIEYVKKIITNYDNINTIGNAYSKILCLNPILVNLSTNRFIRYLLLCGDDKENAEHTLVSFFNGDLINSMTDDNIEDTKESKDNKIKEHLQHIKNQITLIKCNFDNINEKIKSLEYSSPYEVNIADICDILKPKSSVTWNSFDSGYVLRSDNLLELFFKINQKLMTRGKLTKIRDNSIREINNMMTIYSGPLLDNLDDVFSISPSRIKDYYDEFRSRILPKDQSYTYSTRIFIEKIIDELKKDGFTKRAYSPIFYPDDYDLKNNPCAIGVHYLLVGNRLHSSIFFRSNDMFRAWPLNMLGFRFQQRLIADAAFGSQCEIGPTTIISSSAHIYSENWGDANELINKIKYIKNKFYDPEGYFICSKEEDNTILINYFSIDGKIQWMWQKPNEEYEELINEVSSFITDTQHAGYIAKEITKLSYNIYTENSSNKMLKNTPSCNNSNDKCTINKINI